MARNKGIAQFAVNFEPTGQSPFDARLLVPTKADLYTAYPNNNYYPNMIVTVQDENAQYMLVDVTKRTTAEGWLKMGDSKLSTNVDNLTTYYTYQYPSTQNGIRIKAKLGTDSNGQDLIQDALRYYKNKNDNKIHFELGPGGGYLSYDPTSEYPNKLFIDAIKINSDNQKVSIGTSCKHIDIGNDNSDANGIHIYNATNNIHNYLRLRTSENSLDSAGSTYVTELNMDTNSIRLKGKDFYQRMSGNVLDITSKSTYHLLFSGQCIEIGDGENNLLKNYHDTFFALNRLSSNSTKESDPIIKYNTDYEESDGTNPNYLKYFGYLGANFAECREGSNKVTIPQNTFDDTDAVNKKYVVEGEQLTNEDLFTLTPGIYWADHNNSCTNKPTNITAFSLKVEKVGVNNLYLELTSGANKSGVSVGDQYYVYSTEGSQNPDGTYQMNYGEWKRIDKHNPSLSGYAKKSDLDNYVNTTSGEYVKDVLTDFYYSRDINYDFSNTGWSINEGTSSISGIIYMHRLIFNQLETELEVGDGIVLKETNSKTALYNESSGNRPIKISFFPWDGYLIVESDKDALSNTEHIVYTRTGGNIKVTVFSLQEGATFILNQNRWTNIYSISFGLNSYGDSIYKVLPDGSKELVYVDDTKAVDLSGYLKLSGGTMSDNATVEFRNGTNESASLTTDISCDGITAMDKDNVTGDTMAFSTFNSDGFEIFRSFLEQGVADKISTEVYEDYFGLNIRKDLQWSELNANVLRFYNGPNKSNSNLTGLFNGYLLHLGLNDDLSSTGSILEDYSITFGKTTTNPKSSAIINAKGFRSIENDPTKVFTTDGRTATLPKQQILTQSEYDALETKDENTIYFIKSDNPIDLTFVE